MLRQIVVRCHLDLVTVLNLDRVKAWCVRSDGLPFLAVYACAAVLAVDGVGLAHHFAVEVDFHVKGAIVTVGLFC
jgi:hypothetical protein